MEHKLLGIVYPGNISNIKLFDNQVNPLAFCTNTYLRCVDVNPRLWDQKNKFNQGINKGISEKLVERAYVRKTTG